MILGETDTAEHRPGLQIVIAYIQRAHGQLDGGKLVGVIENRKIGWKSGGRSFAAK